jgi:hypothetical protein
LPRPSINILAPRGKAFEGAAPKATAVIIDASIPARHTDFEVARVVRFIKLVFLGFEAAQKTAFLIGAPIVTVFAFLMMAAAECRSRQDASCHGKTSGRRRKERT